MTKKLFSKKIIGKSFTFVMSRIQYKRKKKKNLKFKIKMNFAAGSLHVFSFHPLHARMFENAKYAAFVTITRMFMQIYIFYIYRWKNKTKRRNVLIKLSLYFECFTHFSILRAFCVDFHLWTCRKTRTVLNKFSVSFFSFTGESALRWFHIYYGE